MYKNGRYMYYASLVPSQKDYSALMEAAAHNHVDVIRVLVYQQDDLGDTEIPTLVSSYYL